VDALAGDGLPEMEIDHACGGHGGGHGHGHGHGRGGCA
jgi:hypothetical protein